MSKRRTKLRARNGTIVGESPVTLPDAELKKLAEWQPNIRERLRNVEIKWITYLSHGLRVNGYLVVPKKGKKLPCVIVNRGGNRELGAWSDASAAAQLADLASWGYVVVASQYRGCAGGEGQDEFGGRDVNDVLSLIPLLRAVLVRTRRASGCAAAVAGES